jgi:hypothetical protein
VALLVGRGEVVASRSARAAVVVEGDVAMSEQLRCRCRMGDHNARTCAAGPALAFEAGSPGVAFERACELNRQDVTRQRTADYAETMAIGRYRSERRRAA